MTCFRRERRTCFEQAYDGATPPLDWRDGRQIDVALSSAMLARAEHAVLERELRASQRAAARHWPGRRRGADRMFRALRCRLVHLWESIHQSDSQTGLGEC